MKNKALVLAFAAAAVVAFGVPAMAGTFTSTDGSLSVELPNDSWTTFENSNNWISLSDGNSVLTIDRFTVGDVLPAPITTDADDATYVETFQTVFSNKNEIYLFTGSVKDETKLKDITDIILSANVLKLNTAPAAAKDTKKDAAPTATPAPKTDKTVSTTITVYDEFGNAFSITSAADGLWYASDGTAYTRLSDTDFQVYEGMKRVFTYNPAAGDGMVPEEYYETDGFDPDAEEEGLVPGYNYDTDGIDPAAQDEGNVPEEGYETDGIDPAAQNEEVENG